MFVAYYRVSTQKQGASGLGLDAQRALVEAHAASGTVIAEYTEVESGKRKDRPQLALALAHAKRCKATLLIAKLDRLARSNAFVANLLEAGVPLVAADMPTASVPMLQMMSVFAEMEGKAISDRTKAALAQARARGVQLGGCRGEARTRADAHVASMAPIIKEIAASGATRASAIAAALNARGIPTSRGGTWQCVQVQRLLDRIA